MSLPLYCRPSDIVTAGATVSVIAGAAAAAYPVGNLTDRRAHTVARSTGTTISYRAVFGAAKTIQAVALINTNATAATLTNTAGLSQAITIPTTPPDGLPLDPWKDLRAASSPTSTTWSLALTGPTGVALGEWLLVETLREIPLLWRGLDQTEAHGTIQRQTDYGVRLSLGLGVRQRVVEGSLIHETFRPSLLALQRDAEGPRRPFLLVLEPAQPECLYVDLTTPARTVSRRHPIASGADLIFTEQQKGWL